MIDGCIHVMMPVGSINAWQCEACGQLTSAVHVDPGVTPMFLACRATPGCRGRGTSRMYAAGATPVEGIRFEWRAATKSEMKRWRHEDPAMHDHCRLGGLVLGPLSARGLEALAFGEGVAS